MSHPAVSAAAVRGSKNQRGCAVDGVDAGGEHFEAVRPDTPATRT